MRVFTNCVHSIVAAVAGVLLGSTPAAASILYVEPGSAGSGSSTAPFGTIAAAIAVARAGDDIVVRPGTYVESLRTVRGGTGNTARLVIRAERTGTVTIRHPSRTVLRVSHPYVTVRGVVIDGEYADADAVVVDSAASGFILLQSEVRRTSRDCIDLRSPANVLIDQSLVHHCLNATGGRTDAHGIVAGAVRNLTIRSTRIHTFSGDGVQLDPGRTAPGWDQVTIVGCQIWLEPLPSAENGFPAGAVPGENALDTKTLGTAPRATIRIRQTEAWGFRHGLLTNMAAFNIKEHVYAFIDRVTVSQSEIAFRLRGPGPNGGAHVRVQNAVVYDVATGVRYEDDIKRVEVWNSTFGRDVTRPFRAASSGAGGLDVRNVLFIGSTRPSELAGLTNLPVGPEVFVSAATHDYRLRAGSLPVDAGASLPAVTTDRDGVKRPYLSFWDVGAYEWAGDATAR